MINPDVRATMSSPISEAYAWVDEVGLAPDVELIDVSQAVPGYPPAAELSGHLQTAVQDASLSRYGPVLGMPDVREAFAADTSRAYQAMVTPREVAITAGCNQAFTLAATAVCRAGDEMIIPVPYYFNHDMWLRIQGIRPRYLSCGEGMLPSPDEVSSLINDRTRALLLVTPNNPTGTVYPPELIGEFFDLAQRHGIRLILDETYRDFRDTTAPAHDLFAADWHDTLIHLYSFSKAFSITGYRVGAMAAAPGVLVEVDKIADCITICPSRLAQEAARFGMEHLGPWVEANRRTMNRRVDRFRAEMRQAGTGYEIVAAGAYFAYVRHPFPGHPGKTVALRLLQSQGVLALAGEMFGPDQEPYLRLAFANLDDERIPELVARLAAA